MSNTLTPPGLILGNGTDGNSASKGTPPQLQVILQNLMTGAADITAINGVKVLVISSGVIGTAGTTQIGNTETAGQVAANFSVLQNIAAFCQANGIVVQVDAGLTNPAINADGSNALVDQWATAASQASLPIASVEDVEEIAISQSQTSFTNYASIEANAIQTLINDYKDSSYTLTDANLAIGDMEGGGASSAGKIATWIADINAANTNLGLGKVSFFTADMGWFAPWISEESQPAWEGYLEVMSSLCATNSLSLNVIVQGTQADPSGSQFVQQAEQFAAALEQLQAKGQVDVANLLALTWQLQPIGTGAISSPTSTVNEAAELAAVDPLYLSGAISATETITATAPSQIVFNTGTWTPIVPLTIQWSDTDILANNRLGVVIIDQTGILAATQIGSGTVSSLASNILVLTGDAEDLATELRSVTLLEANAGPDTVDVETWGTSGRLSDNQIDVLAASGSIAGNVSSSSNQQGWISATDLLNTGTILTAGSVLTSQTLYWSTTGTTAVGQPAYVKTVGVHAPLDEYGVENTPTSLQGTTNSAVMDVYDPNVDSRFYPSGGYANNTLSPVTFSNSGWLDNAFNAADELTALAVSSTVNTFDSDNGLLLTSVDNLAPNSPTVIVNGATLTNSFATAFANGGRQITIMNTGNNSAWEVGWGNQFASATLTYDSAGMLVETFLQGGPSNPAFTVDNIYDPNSGQLWEQFQTTDPPPESTTSSTYVNTVNPYEPGFVTGPYYVLQENISGNPNWDGLDWGGQIAAATEVWTDYFLMAAYPGFAVSLPISAAGDMGSYPLQFVNGSILDLLSLPGTIAVNLNALNTVIIQSMTLSSQLSGVTEIDAWGATGTVTLTGLMAGGSTIIGGDNVTTIQGYGNDAIIAGAGVTTINTGSGSSTIQLASAMSTVTVFGNNNTIVAADGSTLTVSGTGNVVTAGTNVTIALSGNDDTATLDYGSSIIVNGQNDRVTTWMNAAPGLLVKPFNTTVIADSAGQNEIIIVSLSGGSGSLSLTGNFTANGNIYTDIGSASDLTSALQAMVFTPNQELPDQTVTTTFIVNTDTDGQSTSDDLTTVIATGINPPDPDNFSGGTGSNILYQALANDDIGYARVTDGVQGGWTDYGPQSAAYSLVGIGDFNDDGSADILFRDNATGDTDYLANGASAGWVDLGTSSTAYAIAATGDFDGNGTSDLLFRDSTSGDMGMFLLGVNGTNVWQDFGTSSLLYSVVGIGDFTGSGKDDILFENAASGNIGYFMPSSQTWIDLGTASTAYSVVGIGDFTGSGTSDILFRDKASGDVGYLAMPSSGGLGTWIDLGASSTAYSVVAIGDFAGNGTSNILFRNNATGDTGYYVVPTDNSAGVWQDLGPSSTAYHVVGSPTYGAPISVGAHV